jgi:hypothetical protein
MKITLLLALPATALLLGFSSLTLPDRTTVSSSSNSDVAPFSRTGKMPVPQEIVEQASCLFPKEVQDLHSNTLLSQSQPEPSQERRHPPHPPRIDFATAAKQLGVTETQLIKALGLPAKPPEPPPTDNNRPPCLPPPPPLDIPGAAKKLGVTEARLIQILGIPPRPPGIPPRPPGRS